MAGETSPPGGTTRHIQTTRGLLSYSELAPLLAERVLRVEAAIASGRYSAQALDAGLVLQFHSEIAGELVPEWGGRWRNVEVRVGDHHPPAPYRVPLLMQDYGEDLRIRMRNADSEADDLLLENLAFAEGRLLSIHPFNDFNGRVARLVLREILRRLEMPPVDLVPDDAAGTVEYFAALRAGDQNNWRPLMKIWELRFEHYGDGTP